DASPTGIAPSAAASTPPFEPMLVAIFTAMSGGTRRRGECALARLVPDPATVIRVGGASAAGAPGGRASQPRNLRSRAEGPAAARDGGGRLARTHSAGVDRAGRGKDRHADRGDGDGRDGGLLRREAGARGRGRDVRGAGGASRGDRATRPADSLVH